MTDSIAALLTQELDIARRSIDAVVLLLDDGATVPFIARYRKEATGGLDEVQLRTIMERLAYLRELADRKKAISAEIEKQGKMTDALRGRIEKCMVKAELEDLYLPFKPKRRTRATIAKERGLEPLADRMAAQVEDGDPDAEAKAFVALEREVPDVEAALAGARDICAERVAESAEARGAVRSTYLQQGTVRVQKAKEHADKATKFDTYEDFEGPVKGMPSHRFLAIRRGEKEGVLRSRLTVDVDALVVRLAGIAGVRPRSPFGAHLEKAVADAYKRLLAPSVEVDVRVELKLSADRDAVGVFADNLRELLLAAPYGTKAVLGIDPGQRTGCKCAVVDETGKLLDHTTIYLVQGDAAQAKAKVVLRDLCAKHSIAAVAVGNGTHGRETEAFVRDVLSAEGLAEVPCVPVSESGASIYSASDVAREEFPDLDLTVRGAISIARRLQDPLAELVKVDPKSIGVGQYQHDVSATLLTKKLHEVVESCVNQVGVEVNTASAPLLSRVAGIGPRIAKAIVAHRDQKGSFKSRRDICKVAGLGAKTFEQAAGFLRVRGGKHPLDGSAVHPERYELVERIAKDLGIELSAVVGNESAISGIDAKRYATDDVGDFT